MKKQEAVNLWSELRGAFRNMERIISRIIEEEAWIPLGYETFSEAWAAQVGDETLAPEVRPHVVYQMLTEGLSETEVAAQVKGIGPDRAASLNRQRKNGVPAQHASMHTVRTHARKNPSAPDSLHLKIGMMKLKRYGKIAAQRGRTVEEIAREAIEAAFE